MAQHDTYTQKMLENFGKRIKARRIELGYANYEKFAFAKDLNRAQYGRYEKGNKDLRFSSIFKIIQALEMTPAEFFREGFEIEAEAGES